MKFAKKCLPDAPGVYFFIRKNKILYIGRATSLRDRVASYAKDDLITSRGPLLVDMVSRTDTVKWNTTDSVLEAIILESNLIKRYQPKYNTQEKDDRSYNYVVITDEDFPRILLMRGRELEAQRISAKRIFGPYPQGGLLRQALVIIRKIFPFRDERAGIPSREAFYRSIGLSPDTSSPEAKKAYAKTICNLTLFFEGKKKALIKSLEKEMHVHATRREFEAAGRVKKTLYALGHIQDVSLIKKDIENIGESGRDVFRIEAYDVAHMAGSENVGVMTVVEGRRFDLAPNKNEYRKFKISRNVNDDVGSLSEILRRRFDHAEWRLPDLVVVDGGSGQIHAAEKIISQTTFHIPVLSVVKDERHKARDIMKSDQINQINQVNKINDDIIARYRSAILLANAEAHRFAIAFHRRRLSKKMLGRNSIRK
jgi:excinuclease ABC subunit C